MLNWLSRFTGARRNPNGRPHIEAVARHNAYLWPNLAETAAQSRVYQQSPWVYIAVNRIAEAAALVPLRVLRRVGEDHAEVERHPLEDLLDAPNPFLSRFELMEQTIGMLELTGNAYWFLVGGASGVPLEIWPLRPDRVSIVPHEVRHIGGYVYEIDGQRIPLSPEEVVHFRRWHPANDYYGLSALETARLAVQGDHAMAEWNRNTFGQNNGVPAGVVAIKEFVSDSDFDRIKREWRSAYGGPQRRTAFLRGGGIEWQSLGLSHHELDFLKGRQAHRDEILNTFGIPVGLVSENATEANATVAERQFIERTLWPKLVRIAGKITGDLLPFWPGDYVAEFEDIRPTDARTRIDEIRAAYPVLSVNEIRGRFFNLPPVTWGVLPVGAGQPSGGGENPDSETTATAAAATNDSADTTTRKALSAVHNAEPGTRNFSAEAELAAWERFVLRRWGRPAARSFAVRALPEETAFAVSAALLAAETPDEARAVFTAARADLEQMATKESLQLSQ